DGGVFVVAGRQTDEGLRIARMDDLRPREQTAADGIVEVAATGRNLNRDRRTGGAGGAKNNVFLKNGFGGKRRRAGLENVETAKGHAGEEIASEGKEIRAVAKAARHDGNQFRVGFQQTREQ